MRPASFDVSLSADWSSWVLAHGLPELPGPDLAVDQSVPVAYWISLRTAAVLHIRRLLPEEDDMQDVTELDIDLFHLVDETWSPCGGGGGGWPNGLRLARIDVPPNHVNLHGMNSGAAAGRGCTALWGEVGIQASAAEVRQAGHTTRRAVEAPTGAFVVRADYDQPFTVRILDARGELLAEIDEPAGLDDENCRPF